MMYKEKIKKYIKKNWLFVVGFIGIILFVYSDFFFGDYEFSYTNLMYYCKPWQNLDVETKGPVYSDVVDSFVPELYTAIGDEDIGEVWDSDTALGTTNNLSAYLYPLNYLFLLPLDWASIFRALLEFFIAFYGMYKFMGSLGCRKLVASIAGISYCFSSVMVLWLGWQHSDVTALAPLAFFFFEKFVNTLKIKYCFGITGIVYFMLVAGMPTYAAYFLYLMALYVFFHTCWTYKKNWRAILTVFSGTLTAVLLAIVCSLPYTVDLLNTVGNNGYADSRMGKARDVLPWESLQAAFLPYARIETSIHMNESTIYVGLAVLLLLIFSILNLRKKRIAFWGVSWIFLFLAIFTHTIDDIFIHLPAINTSSKIRILVLLNFTAIILAGLNLNDFVENRSYYLKNKGKTILLLLLGTALMVRALTITSSIREIDEYFFYYQNYIIILSLVIIAIILFLIKKVRPEVILFILCIVVSYDMGTFVKENIPLIEKSADALPEATEAIQYLQDNTEDERITAVGSWTLFPNTSIYYGLDDIRGHNFVFTNEDMQNYYTKMDDNGGGFQSGTRYIMTPAYHETMLQYLGVKYVVKETSFSGQFTAVGPIYNEKSIRQEVVLEKDNPQAIVLLMGTNGNDFLQKEKIKISFVERETGEEVYASEHSMKGFRDNASEVLKFDSNELQAGVVYDMIITTNTEENRSISCYLYNEFQVKCAYYEDRPQTRELVCDIINSDGMIGEDGLIVEPLDTYTERLELVDNVQVFSEEKSILRKMSEVFEKNTAYVMQKEAEKLSLDEIGPIEENDSIELVEKKEDHITAQVKTETAKLLMLNEYYTSDWKVFVNGEEQELIKVNYLFKGVQVPKGESVVEFVYQPTLLYGMLKIMGGGILVILCLGILQKKIQKQIDEKVRI